MERARDIRPSGEPLRIRMREKARILFVDDEPAVLQSLERCLASRRDQWECEFFEDPEEALARFTAEPFDVVMADMRMQGMNGAEFLHKVEERAPETVRLMLTGSTDLKTALAAINRGHVFQFLLKPCDRDQIIATVEKAVRQHVLQTAERDLLKAQLEHAQKLGLIGQMAAGVAHDLNNILGCITILSDPSMFPADAPGTAQFAQINKAASNAAALSRELTSFSRPAEDHPPLERLDLCEVVRECVVMLKPLLQARVKFTVILSDDAVPVRGHSGRLKQIIVNLVTNARDAIAPDGRIELAVGIDDPVDGQQAGPLLARLTVRDWGHGMDEATRQRIFEPFFTTKEKGEGTGLGLATVKQLVRSHGGRLEVESVVDQGSTFKVLLPLHP